MSERVILHRCPFAFLKTPTHGCNNVQKALEEQGIPFDVKHSVAVPRGLRKDLQRATGQVMLPAIEFADGTAYRDESTEMVKEIGAGRLFDHRTPI